MMKKALAYVFIYGVTAGALVLALVPGSFGPAGGTNVVPTAGVVPAVQVTIEEYASVSAAARGERCPYLAASAAAGRCPYLSAIAAARCPGVTPSGPATQGGGAVDSCPYLHQQRGSSTQPDDGVVRAVLDSPGEESGARPQSL